MRSRILRDISELGIVREFIGADVHIGPYIHKRGAHSTMKRPLQEFSCGGLFGTFAVLPLSVPNQRCGLPERAGSMGYRVEGEMR